MQDVSSLAPSAAPQSPPELQGIRRRYFQHFVPDDLSGDAPRLDLRRRARLFVAACHLSVGLILVSALTRVGLGKVPSRLWWVLLGITLCAMAFGPYWLRRTRSLRQAAVLPVGAACGLPLLALQSGGLNAPVMGILPAIPLIAAFFVGVRGALGVAIGLAVEVAALALALHEGWLSAAPEPPGLVKATLFGFYFLAGALVARIYDRETRSVEARLHDLARQLYEASIHDPLTGVLNRRFFAKQLVKEMAYARRHGTTVSVVILDIDHFKQVNDVFGHSTGDTVLCDVAARLKRQLRDEDYLARFGGEEFVVLLRGVHATGAAAAAERLRAAVAANPVEARVASIPVTISVGCATHAGGEGSGDELLSLADARLYLAKRSGRNRVVADGDATPSESGELQVFPARPLA